MSETVELLTDVGPLLFPADDQVMTPFVRAHGFWEPDEAALIRSTLGPGMTFVDVGAHVGYLTAVAADAVGPGGSGLAIEASPETFTLLEANLARHERSHVEARHAAAWDKPATIELALSDDNSGDHRAMATDEPSAQGPEAEPFPGRRQRARTVSVSAIALDDIIGDDMAVDFVKVDVQGADHRALRGMERVLEESHPIVLVEFWPEGIREMGDDPADVLHWYASLAYRISFLDDPTNTDLKDFDEMVRVAFESEHRYRNIVLRP